MDVENNEIIEVLVSTLKAHPLSLKIYNSSLTSVKQLAETIKVTGQLEPIIINKENLILSGVRRWKAFKHLNIPLIKAIKINSQNSEEENIVYYNQQRKKTTREIINEAEYILGLLGKKQGVRNDLLKVESGNLFGLIGRDRFEIAANFIGGMSASTLRRLMDVVEFEKKSIENKNLGLVDKIIKKEITASRAQTIIKSIIKDNLIRNKVPTKLEPINNDHFQIYNKSSENMSEIKSNSVQVVFTSPPYFNLRNYGNTTDERIELGHEDTPHQFVSNLSIHLRDVKRVLKNEGSFFLNIGETYNSGENLLIPTRLLLELCDSEGWYIINEIIWQKTNALPQSSHRRLQPTYEKIFHLVKDPVKYYYEDFRIYNDNELRIVQGPGIRNVDEIGPLERGITLSRNYQRFKDFIDEQKVVNVIQGPNAGGRQMELKRISNIDHPALMPDYLPIIPILTTSKIGDIILDPFSGSGTTGKTSLSLGRKFIGYELNEDNFNLSCIELTNLVKEINELETKKEIEGV